MASFDPAAAEAEAAAADVPADDDADDAAAPGLMIIEFCSHSVQMLACMWIQTMQPRSLLTAGFDTLGEEVEVVDVPAHRVRGIMDGGASLRSLCLFHIG